MTQYSHLRKLALGLLVAAVVAVGSSVTARADIIVIQGVDNTGTDNVLLNPTDPAGPGLLTVTGTVGQNNLLVNFTSTGGFLHAPASGQARVTGGTGNVDFNNITFGLANGNTFTQAVFNVNANLDGFIRLTVEGVNITGGTFIDEFEVDLNGENFFTVSAINGQLITSITIDGLDGVTFEDLRQIRIGGGDVVGTVPEPASMLLLGTGLIGVAGAARRRFKAGK